MQLDAFILADAVATPPDGKFYVHGGGLSRMEAPSLPWPIQLSALIRLHIDEKEAQKSHHLRLTLVGPTGQPNVQPIEVEASFSEAATLLPGEQRFAHIAAPVNGLAIRTGLYRVELQVDDVIDTAISFPLIVLAGAEEVTPPVAAVAVAPRAAAAGKPRPPKRQKRPPPPPKKKAKRR
jgi:hypothetical protein